MPMTAVAIAAIAILPASHAAGSVGIEPSDPIRIAANPACTTSGQRGNASNRRVGPSATNIVASVASEAQRLDRLSRRQAGRHRDQGEGHDKRELAGRDDDEPGRELLEVGDDRDRRLQMGMQEIEGGNRRRRLHKAIQARLRHQEPGRVRNGSNEYHRAARESCRS